jgi:hypothetical protein
MSAISVIVLTAIMGFSVACSRHPGDEKIVRDIQDKVAKDPDTKQCQVDVASTEGKIKLSGKVKSSKAQKKVEQIAREEPGTAGVDDETTVEPEPATQGVVSQPSSQEVVSPLPPTPPVEKPKPQPMIVPSGTVLTVTTSQPLSSKTSKAGQPFVATLHQPVTVDGQMALPTGATVNGTVVSAKSKGKVKGEGELSLALTSISVDNQTFDIQTNVLTTTAKGKGKRTAATTGGGAAGGALIGGLAGGGKGAGIGALVGAGAGFIGGAVTGNKQIEIPAETALSFTLATPLTLPPGNE